MSIKLKLCRLLVSLMPAHSRRVAFIASIESLLSDGGEVSDRELQRINDAFGLAGDHTALRFPTMVSGLIWSKDLMPSGTDAVISALRDPAKLKARGFRDKLVDALVSIAPGCVKYDARRMRADAVKLVDMRATAG